MNGAHSISLKMAWVDSIGSTDGRGFQALQPGTRAEGEPSMEAIVDERAAKSRTARGAVRG